MFILEKSSAEVGRGIHFSFSSQSESCRDSGQGNGVDEETRGVR